MPTVLLSFMHNRHSISFTMSNLFIWCYSLQWTVLKISARYENKIWTFCSENKLLKYCNLFSFTQIFLGVAFQDNEGFPLGYCVQESRLNSFLLLSISELSLSFDNQIFFITLPAICCSFRIFVYISMKQASELKFRLLFS